MPEIYTANDPHSLIRGRFTAIGLAQFDLEREALHPVVFDVEDNLTGEERCLKLWRKVGNQIDHSVRELWLHEMRQVQRVMAYSGAKEVILNALELVEDELDFGIVFVKAGQPLSTLLDTVSRRNWLKNTTSPRPRSLLWQNALRIVRALDIIHAQGLVHGHIGLESIYSDGADEADFQLGGFEWSVWIGQTFNQAHSNEPTSAQRVKRYSFAEDWRALGAVLARLLNVSIDDSGETNADYADSGVVLTVSERNFLKRLVSPSMRESLDGASLERAIKDIIADVASSTSIRSGNFVMMIGRGDKFSERVYDATNGEIAVDEYYQQLEWVRADIDGGARLFVPKNFDPKSARMKLVTSTMVYRLRAFLDAGEPTWEIAYCDEVTTRDRDARNDMFDEHPIEQPIDVAPSQQKARELRAQLGPDLLPWSVFAIREDDRGPDNQELVKKSLVLIQLIEAIVKTLEIYPIELAKSSGKNGRYTIQLKPGKHSDRDRLAKKFKIQNTADSFRRLFEEDQRESNGKWSIGPFSGLGDKRSLDVNAIFNDVGEIDGIRVYEFETDDEVAAHNNLFLRAESDSGTEQVIRRRLRNLALLETRVDLLDVLYDPWRIRRSSRDILDETDEAFKKLDDSKKHALREIWKTLPTYFVVGPPGVGKTLLATEVVKRRLTADSASRILLSAQGHDALDNLQTAVERALADAGITDAIVVRSAVPNDRRSNDKSDVNQTTKKILQKLEQCNLVKNAPAAIRARISELNLAALNNTGSLDSLNREDRVGIEAISNLVLDSANIVVSTANSPDIERMIEERQQFDSVIIEEAAKATGPEIVGPLMLSGRRLLIGDHNQLPPFDCDRIEKILTDHSALTDALKSAEQRVGNLFYESGLEEMLTLLDSSEVLKSVGNMAARLLQPFKTFTMEDDRKLQNPTHRAISTTLSEQRRMDPAIAEIVSTAFYPGKLRTAAERIEKAIIDSAPFARIAPLPASPIVVIDFAHVSSTGKEKAIEHGHPRWHNSSEVDAVINVLRCIRSKNFGEIKPTLAVLAPYAAQVERIREKITHLRSTELLHLDKFLPVRAGMDFVGTVDSFQGSEADIVIISLVRNNPRTGHSALGFLTDRRRMNVLLSRAKYQMVIVGSTRFLHEAVKGVNPSDGEHDLSFINDILAKIRQLESRKRDDGVPFATILPATIFKS